MLRNFIKVVGLPDKEGQVQLADSQFVCTAISLYSRQGIMHYAHCWQLNGYGLQCWSNIKLAHYFLL
jgi:hypothetical protein